MRVHAGTEVMSYILIAHMLPHHFKAPDINPNICQISAMASLKANKAEVLPCPK
jgi:hypothetical protein